MKTFDKPELIHNVSDTQFSLARHCGGCTVNGTYYVYHPASDTLMREDVVKKQWEESTKAVAEEKKKQQESQQAFTEF